MMQEMSEDNFGEETALQVLARGHTELKRSLDNLLGKYERKLNELTDVNSENEETLSQIDEIKIKHLFTFQYLMNRQFFGNTPIEGSRYSHPLLTITRTMAVIANFLPVMTLERSTSVSGNNILGSIHSVFLAIIAGIPNFLRSHFNAPPSFLPAYPPYVEPKEVEKIFEAARNAICVTLVGTHTLSHLLSITTDEENCLSHLDFLKAKILRKTEHSSPATLHSKKSRKPEGYAHNFMFKSQLPSGLVFQKITADAHCFYNAVALYAGMKQQELRNLVASRVQQGSDSDELRALLLERGLDVSSYLAGVQANQWAGDVEMEILMRILGQRIVVIGNQGTIVNESLIRGRFSNNTPIFVFYNGRDHYDALLLQAGHDGEELLNNIVQRQVTLNFEHTQPESAHEPHFATTASNDKLKVSNSMLQEKIERLTEGMKQVDEKIVQAKKYRKILQAVQSDVSSFFQGCARGATWSMKKYEALVNLSISDFQTEICRQWMQLFLDRTGVLEKNNLIVGVRTRQFSTALASSEGAPPVASDSSPKPPSSFLF